MPKCENRTLIYKKLSEYRNIVLENDSLIRSLDFLKDQDEISPSQYSRIDELEKTIIPEAIKKEKAAKEEIDKCINRTKNETTLSPFSLSIIELRYFSALEWPDVAAALYSTAWSNATKTEKASYMNRIFKQHSRTLSAIEKHMPL